MCLKAFTRHMQNEKNDPKMQNAQLPNAQIKTVHTGRNAYVQQKHENELKALTEH